jgi:alanine racemase
MERTKRREFLELAGAASVAVVLTGKLARGAVQRQSLEGFDVDDQIDPWIELDIDALASNVREVRKRIGELPIMAVVKCNAYGHGDVEIATALQRDSDVRHFMVVKTREATSLRRSGIEGMILNAGPFSRREITALLDNDISQSVYSDAVDVLSEEAAKLGKTAKVHVCVDTGMGRVGVPHTEALAFIEKVASLPSIEIEGTFTAMTEDDDFNPIQIERIEGICAEAASRGIATGVRHAASTAEVDRYPYAWLDMVRPGNCLVGLEPERQNNMAIRPVMAFKTRVVYVKTLQAGEALSYHRAYKINNETRIATLPCGYSDGYPPVVTNMADVLIRGRRHRVVAPITANHMMVDVTSSPDVAIGDEVVLWGQQGDQTITKVELEELAPRATNAYRMATRTRTYLPRVPIY